MAQAAHFIYLFMYLNVIKQVYFDMVFSPVKIIFTTRHYEEEKKKKSLLQQTLFAATFSPHL